MCRRRADLVVAVSLTGHVKSRTSTFFEMCALICALSSFHENLKTCSVYSITLTVVIFSTKLVFFKLHLRSNLI